MYKKGVLHVQICCFVYLTYCFSDVIVVVAIVAILRSLVLHRSKEWFKKNFCFLILD